MHLLVNALSIGSMSGQHVVFGFLRPLARWMRSEHEITILHYESEVLPPDLRELGVKSHLVPDRFRNWALRGVWEAARLPSVVARERADVVLNVSGAVAPRCPVPQVVLCQNPWCYVPKAQYGVKQRIKAALQRVGYAKAFRNAEMMIYISGHLRSLYQRGNPGVSEKRSEIAYVGLNESTFAAAKEMAALEREPLTIVSVSAMAPWKGADTLVKAVALLHQRGLPAKLKLVGPWPVKSYLNDVQRLISEHSLGEHVQILGKVSDADLHRLYATSRVFCLMSCCESFGIPAAEAMAFGTPIVGTNCCAIAEVCEGAGQFGPFGNPQWTANALDTALTNPQAWQQWSKDARNRAEMLLAWEVCAEPFTCIPEVCGRPIQASKEPIRTSI